eukprot:c22559_g1_i1 orf=162-2630(-)
MEALMKPSAMASSTTSAFSFLFIFLISTAAMSLAASVGSSISLGSSLSHNQTILSPSGLFQFGFFSLDSSSSSMYLGVTYTSLTPLTAVWVANRDKAVSQDAICTFTADGFVNLTDDGEIVWSIGRTGQNASALVLNDTSNLVLQGANSSTIWQSFDNPGNTWLPGMTLGPGQKLQCWLSETNPTGGSYALVMGKENNFISVYNDTTQYWDSGSWDGSIFSLVPEMTAGYIYTFKFNSSTGFTYYVKANQSAGFNISKFVMKSSGLIVESSYDPGIGNWNDFWSRPNNPCDAVRLCGQNSICTNTNQLPCACPAQGFRPVNQLEWDQKSFFHGCERKSPLNCSVAHGSNDGFLPINQTSFSSWNFTSSVAMADLQTCKDRCLANCSCNGFYFDGDGAGNCSVFTENLYQGIISSSPLSGSFYLRVAALDLASDNGSSSSSKTSMGLIIGVAVTSIAILVMVSLVVTLIIRRRKLTAAAKTSEAGLTAFSYAELQAATKNFKERLGSGGFGIVYRGVVVVSGQSSGTTNSGGAASLAVAVKKLHRLDEGDKQFRAEVRTIGTVQHVNLVRLLGFCCEGKHRLLVYELAENGSLDSALFRDDARAAPLSWPIRFNIALGVARGIAYLHESCRECIIHCDIKPENILLDSSYDVRVADFGLAKLVGRQFSHVLTTLRGTRGYLAPEWIAGLPITAKADVYSFGMTILELLSGHRNINNAGPTPTQDDNFFPIWAAQIIHKPEANLTCLLDPRLQGQANMEELQRVAYCAIWCIQDNEDSRPTMGKVVQMLEGTLPLTIPPIPKSLESLVETESLTSKSSLVFSQE